MGKVQTSCRGSTKQAGRWTWTGVCVGAGQKRLRPRKGIEGAQKKIGRPYGYQGHGGGSPARKDYRLRQRRCRRSDSGTGHTRLATEKWVMERMQKNNHRQKARMALSAKGWL